MDVVSGRVTGKRKLLKGDHDMSVATVTEISATSKDGFEAAVNEAIARANLTRRCATWRARGSRTRTS